VDGKTSRPTHRDKAAMNGAQRRVVETKFMTGPPAPVGVSVDTQVQKP
jgi:hypothetical protein